MTEAINKLLADVQSTFNGLPGWVKIGISGGATVAMFVYVRGRYTTVSRPITKVYQKGRIYLYQFPRTLVLPSLSPYSLKVETWLRMAELDYENVDMPKEIYSLRSKEGTLPFVEVDGVEYDDSDFIIRDMITLKGKQSMTAHLDAAELGKLRAVDRMVENSTIMSYGYFRYTEHINEVFGPKYINHDGMPLSVRVMFTIMMPFMARGIKKTFKVVGIGKHPRHEIEYIGLTDLRALSDILGDRPYFGGQQPTQTDACVFSLTAQMIYMPLDVPHLSYVKKDCQNLVEHAERIKNEFWPDWEEVTRGQKANSDAWKKK